MEIGRVEHPSQDLWADVRSHDRRLRTRWRQRPPALLGRHGSQQTLVDDMEAEVLLTSGFELP